MVILRTENWQNRRSRDGNGETGISFFANVGSPLPSLATNVPERLILLQLVFSRLIYFRLFTRELPSEDLIYRELGRYGKIHR